ncbi:TetR/AcrR family transcriptional regulator [Streptomyces sp. NPDC051569]|uniref:TetR/AcrR family transcriptional regulator n=1 Tax=Streptomyces sp. NPDC051569 TaxID=3365661 RepID=UPI0037B0BFA1
MSVTSSASARRGRLSPERERELLEATLDLVAELGYEQLTMAEVAKRTKSSTATLYRQWESKPKLVIVALKARSEARKPSREIDTGSLRDDLLEVARDAFGDRPTSDSMASVWHAIVTDRELMEALREILAAPAMEMVQRILTRAMERGEIKDGPAAALTVQVLFGPPMIQELLTGESASLQLAEDVIHHILMPALTASVGKEADTV